MTGDEPDPRTILAALGVPEPEVVARVTGGVDTALWRIEVGNRPLALRVLRADQLASGRREVAATAAVRAAGLPAPRVYVHRLWQGRPAVLMEWLPGRPLLDGVRAEPARAAALGSVLGRTQAALHRIDAPEALIAHPAPWIEWAKPSASLRERLRATAQRETALLHLDYHTMNVLVHDGEISGILDWANCRAGDPRADVARTATILRFVPMPTSLHRDDLESARIELEAGWLQGYQDAAGLLEDMAPFYAWAGAVMVRDLAPRLGRADLPWLTSDLLTRIGDWGRDWERRATRTG